MKKVKKVFYERVGALINLSLLIPILFCILLTSCSRRSEDKPLSDWEKQDRVDDSIRIVNERKNLINSERLRIYYNAETFQDSNYNYSIQYTEALGNKNLALEGYVIDIYKDSSRYCVLLISNHFSLSDLYSRVLVKAYLNQDQALKLLNSIKEPKFGHLFCILKPFSFYPKANLIFELRSSHNWNFRTY